MFSSNLTKFFVVSALSVLLFSGCLSGSNPGDGNSSNALPAADDLKSDVPFSTREPERFQAEIVVTADGAERKTFVARNGTNYRHDFNFGAKNQVTTLSTDKTYLLATGHKIYTEIAPGKEAAPTAEWTSFLTTEWLSGKQDAKFEKLETSGNLTKYRVSLGESPATEVFVYMDETVGLPVKQEFYSIGEQKTLSYAFELKNLKLETDENIFAVPADFRRVSTEEFWKTVRSNRN